MSVLMPPRGHQQVRLARAFTKPCTSLRVLQLQNSRHFSSTSSNSGIFSLKSKSTMTTNPAAEAAAATARANAAIEKAKADAKRQQDEQQSKVKLGGLADTSVFSTDAPDNVPEGGEKHIIEDPFVSRNLEHMERVLNPRPVARTRWQRRMVIRHVRRRGRLTKEMVIARTERKHQIQSHFFKTSIKKLMPLARQIAGKSVDEAILQMRFSNKKVAQDVKAHLIQARNEAIVVKGMGRNSSADITSTLPSAPVVLDPSITPPNDQQTPTKGHKSGGRRNETDIYIAEAWVNRGKFGKQPEYRARGRVNVLRPPHTGITVVLKEEKTRTRQQTEKEVKAIRKRIGKNLWTQLPDRPITRQSQHVLW